MIRNFKHRGLRRLYEDDDRRGVSAEHLEKIRVVLARLDRASKSDDMALPGLQLHPLKGKLAGFWSVHDTGQLADCFPLRRPQCRRC